MVRDGCLALPRHGCLWLKVGLHQRWSSILRRGKGPRNGILCLLCSSLMKGYTITVLCCSGKTNCRMVHRSADLGCQHVSDHETTQLCRYWPNLVRHSLPVPSYDVCLSYTKAFEILGFPAVLPICLLEACEMI